MSKECCPKCDRSKDRWDIRCANNGECECHSEKNILTDISPEKLKQFEESGVPITHLEKNDAPEWRERFEREFKHVHHPNIQAENIINDTKPLIVFIEAEKALSYEEGKRSRDEEVAMKIQDGFKAGVQKAMEVAENAQFEITPIEESIEAGMSEADARQVNSHALGYLAALSDLLTTLEKLDL